MNEPPQLQQPPAKPGLRIQFLLAVVFALLGGMIWWTSRGVAPAPALQVGDAQRGLLVPFVLGALCAAINALAIHGGRVLSPALRLSPILVFFAALLMLRLAG